VQDLLGMKISSICYCNLSNDNNIIITENSESLLISQKQNKNETITTLKNLETGSEDYFIRDEVKGTIYSSITGKTINTENIIYDKEVYSSRGGDIFIKTSTIKYSTIELLVGIGGTLSKIAAAVLVYCSIPASAGVVLILKVLGYLGVGTAGALYVAYPNGGLKLDQYDVERSSIRGGVTYYYYVRSYKNVRHVSVV